MEITKVQLGNLFYIERIERLTKKEKKHILNALYIYCKKRNYSQAIIEHLYNAGLSGAVTVRMKVQEAEGIHIGVFKVDYYRNIIHEKESFDKIKATGGTGSSLFMNIDSVEFTKQDLIESDYKSVIEYTAADGLSESITDLRSFFYKYHEESSPEAFAKDFSKIIHNIFVSNFGLNGVLYSNQKYSSKYYDIHFNRTLQRPPREVFGAEWPPEIYLTNVEWIQEESIEADTKILYFKENVAQNKQMLQSLEKGKQYLFRIDFIKYDISETNKVGEGKHKKRFKFIIPGKYRVDTEIVLSDEQRHTFLDYIEAINIIYVRGTYTKNNLDILSETVRKIGCNPNSDKIQFTKGIEFPNIIPKMETFLDNPLLKVFMECLSFNDPNFNNLLISENQSVKIIDYAMISQNGLYYDLARFETIMKMEFIFDKIYPKYENNIEQLYKKILLIEDWLLYEEKPDERILNSEKDMMFLYIFSSIVRYYMVELADMHYLHTFNEFKSGSFLREYLYSLMFFNISFLKFKHDPPERKKLAFMFASYYMNKLEKSSFVSSAQLNQKIFKIKKNYAGLLSKENKAKLRLKSKEFNPTKFSIEDLLNLINSSNEEEQQNSFEKLHKVKSTNRLFDEFLENYYGDYKNQVSKLFITLSKYKDNPEFTRWLIRKLNLIPSEERNLKFNVLENCLKYSDASVKTDIFYLLYNLAELDFKKALSMVLRLSKGMASRTVLIIIFLLRCKNDNTTLILSIFLDLINDELPLFLKYNILDFVKKNYYKDTEKSRQLINKLSKEKNSKFKTEINIFLEIIDQ